MSAKFPRGGAGSFFAGSLAIKNNFISGSRLLNITLTSCQKKSMTNLKNKRNLAISKLFKKTLHRSCTQIRKVYCDSNMTQKKKFDSITMFSKADVDRKYTKRERSGNDTIEFHILPFTPNGKDSRH